MKIICVGVNHQSAPLEWRQKLAFDRPTTARALALLRTRFDDAEFVILSTCNRVEIYCAARRDAPPQPDDLLRLLAEFHGLPLDELAARAYRLSTDDAVRHLMEVAASLDSMVVGEVQILAQVKEAFVQALEAEATGKYLNRLFHRAFGAAKRVHTATSIGRRRTSVASVAVDFATRIFSGLDDKRVLVIGAGDTAEAALAHLASVGAGDVTVVNRSAERAQPLVARFGARLRPWDQLDDALVHSDIVVCSTSSPEPILHRPDMADVHRRRHWANWMILDLGVPRNVDADVGRMSNVYLYDLDAVGRVVSENVCLREQEVDVAADIVADETQAFLDWFEARDVGPLVEKLEARLHALGDEEVDRLFKRLPDDTSPDVRNEIRLATHRIVHKLLHEPIDRLKTEARGSHGQMAIRLMKRLFGLDEDARDE